jgi:hypothetical protein
MAYNVIFTVSGAGSDTGPFNISGTTSSNVTTLIGTYSKAELEAGKEITISDNAITGGTVASTGTCTTSQPWTKPTISLIISARDIGSNGTNYVFFYSINGGSNINVPGYTFGQVPSVCTDIYTITGLNQGDQVTFGTSIGCRINGADNTSSCPASSGSATVYSTDINSPTPDTVALTLNRSIIV